MGGTAHEGRRQAGRKAVCFGPGSGLLVGLGPVKRLRVDLE